MSALMIWKRAIRGDGDMRNSEARGTRSRWILLAAGLMALGACGGGGGEDDVAETTTTAPAKQSVL